MKKETMCLIFKHGQKFYFMTMLGHMSLKWHCRRSLRLWHIYHILRMTLQTITDLGYETLPHPPYSSFDTAETHWLGIWDFATSTIFNDLGYETLPHPPYSSSDTADAHWLGIWDFATNHFLHLILQTLTGLGYETLPPTIFFIWYCRRSLTWDLRLCHIQHILFLTLQTLTDLGFETLPHPLYSSYTADADLGYETLPHTPIHHILFLTLQTLTDLEYETLPHTPYYNYNTADDHWLATSNIFLLIAYQLTTIFSIIIPPFSAKNLPS